MLLSEILNVHKSREQSIKFDLNPQQQIVVKTKLSLVFDFMSVVHIREDPYWRIFYREFMGIFPGPTELSKQEISK